MNERCSLKRQSSENVQVLMMRAVDQKWRWRWQQGIPFVLFILVFQFVGGETRALAAQGS